jgi:hypothetical protein
MGGKSEEEHSLWAKARELLEVWIEEPDSKGAAVFKKQNSAQQEVL